MQRSGSGGMNLSVEDSFEPTTQCSTPVPRAAKGVISVDVGPRVYTDVDLKLKNGSKEYSPVQKMSKPPARQAVSRIHAIPFLMLVVFVLLWAGSTSEVKPNVESTGAVTGATETHAHHRIATRGLPIQKSTFGAKVTKIKMPTDLKHNSLKKDKDSVHVKDKLLRGGMPKIHSP